MMIFSYPNLLNAMSFNDSAINDDSLHVIFPDINASYF